MNNTDELDKKLYKDLQEGIQIPDRYKEVIEECLNNDLEYEKKHSYKLAKIIATVCASLILSIGIVYAVNEAKREPEYIIIGNKIVEVSKGKTREDLLREKELENLQIHGEETQQSDESTGDGGDNKGYIPKPSEEYVILEQKLINLADKYGKKDEYELLKEQIEEQGTIGVVTENHEKICEIFMDLYKNENLTEDEKQSVKEFLEMILFNELDKDLENRIRDLIY